MVIETQFIKMLTYIAYGLREKLQVKENNSYPRSLIFRQGINIFSYLMVVNSGFNDPLYKMVAFIELEHETKIFVLTEDCQDFLSSVEHDLPAIDEHAVYNKLKNLSQNDYVTLRKFLIENPLLCNEKRQELLISYNSGDIQI